MLTGLLKRQLADRAAIASSAIAKKTKEILIQTILNNVVTILAGNIHLSSFGKDLNRGLNIRLGNGEVLEKDLDKAHEKIPAEFKIEADCSADFAVDL